MPQPEVCHEHPHRAAVEHCEVCARPLCGSCLWYADDGRRLCEEHALAWHADGNEVSEPDRYEEGIVYSEVSAARVPLRRGAYRGNSSDVMGLIALILGGGVLLSCFGFWYLLPIVAFIFGLLAWLQSRDALDPVRTRVFAGVGLASGGLFLMFFFGTILLCTLGWVASLAANSISAGVFSP